jgi:hypothetical protein
MLACHPESPMPRGRAGGCEGLRTTKDPLQNPDTRPGTASFSIFNSIFNFQFGTTAPTPETYPPTRLPYEAMRL